MKRKPTSFDIAYRAGVSQSTVSRALRGSPLVSAETRARIQAIAEQLRYKVDKNASSLRRQHATTLALLLFEDPTTDDSLINPFFLSMFSSIMRTCAQCGYDLLISFQQLSDDWHADYQDCHKADGLILLGYGDYLTARDRLQKLVGQNTHFVRWGAVIDGQAEISVGCDNVQGGQAVTEHLLGLGRRHIAFIGNATEHRPEFRDRHKGYLAALHAAGMKADAALQVDALDSTEQLGFQAVQALRDRGVEFDAIFAASDLLAIGAMHALEDAGIGVPEDVSVVGFDDIPTARFAKPPLTTVQQNTKQAGELLVECLLRQIQGEPVDSVLLPAKVMVRRSCGAPPDGEPAAKPRRSRGKAAAKRRGAGRRDS